jgi:ankyrin repeat protein/L-ascorbate metabolism protein UlaG (beta-lactamase superfamily)
MCNKKMVILLLAYLNVFVLPAYAGEIHDAAKSGDLQKVKELLAADPDLVNSKDSKGFTPLHSAVSKGRRTVVQFLVENGADIEVKNKNGLTPLFQALDLNRTRVAKILIENGANVNIKGYRNRTLLHMAARSGNTAIVRQLIDNGANTNAVDSRGNTPLDLAIEGNKPDAARLLITSGGEIGIFTTETEETRRLLNRAINMRQSAIISLIAEVGGNINLKDENGHTLLHKAAAYGRKEIVEILLAGKTNVNAETDNGETPIFFAAKYGHKNIVDLLEVNGAHKVAGMEENYGESVYLKKGLSQKEAYIWYLDHSSWAVKTQNHLLIFDYTDRAEKPAAHFIASGYINPEGIADLNVSVFVSHDHSDHYDSSIFKWRNSITNINYILGFKPRGLSPQEYTFVGPRNSKSVNGIEITTIKSTDAGVGYLLKVDGLTIYHGGDHANKQNSATGPYHKEIDYLAGDQASIDIAFVLSGAACGGGYADCVLQGDFYVIDKLKPNVIFPMHSGGNEHVYKQFARDVHEANIAANIKAAEYRGDRYFYQHGTIK